MKSKAVICAIAALSMSVSGLALAQGGRDTPNWDAQGRMMNDGTQRSDRTQERSPRTQERYDRNGRADGRDGRVYGRDGRDGRVYGRDGRDGRVYGRDGRDGRVYGRGAGPDHSFYRGGRLPREYRSHQYVVDDWRGHRLAAPPRGYHWVQTGGDYVLVAIATGIIASILLSQ